MFRHSCVIMFQVVIDVLVFRSQLADLSDSVLAVSSKWQRSDCSGICWFQSACHVQSQLILNKFIPPSSDDSNVMGRSLNRSLCHDSWSANVNPIWSFTAVSINLLGPRGVDNEQTVTKTIVVICVVWRAWTTLDPVGVYRSSVDLRLAPLIEGWCHT